MNNIIINNTSIGEGSPTFIIAEVGQNHDGSLGTAHAYIDAVAKTGANAIKFQTHIAKAESTKKEKFRIKFSYQDKTRFGYWTRTSFTANQWQELLNHAVEKKLTFLSSPFSMEAVELLEKIGITAWKVGSGEITNTPMIERICSTRKPILFSSGMSSINEIDKAIQCAKEHSIPYGIFQCTSIYPCPPEKIGLNLISVYKKRYKCPSGLSDHSGTIYPSISAVTLGANIIEAHIVFSKECFGPDVTSSITTSEFKQLVDGCRCAEKLTHNHIDKNSIINEISETKLLFEKSIVSNTNLAIGHTITKQDLVLKKPGTGLPPQDLKKIIGKKLLVNCKKNEMIFMHMLTKS